MINFCSLVITHLIKKLIITHRNFTHLSVLSRIGNTSAITAAFLEKRMSSNIMKICNVHTVYGYLSENMEKKNNYDVTLVSNAL